MASNIIDESYNGLDALYANAGKWIDGEVKLYNFYQSGSGVSNKFTIAGNSLTRESGDWGDYGFVPGMTVTMTYTNYWNPPPLNPAVIVKVIDYINGGIMYFTTNFTPAQNGSIFPTTNHFSGMSCEVDQQPEAVEFLFNLNKNGTNSINSVIDQEVNKFVYSSVNTMSILDVESMVQQNFKSGGIIKDVTIKREADGGFFAVQKNYTINFKFLQWGLIQDGFEIPSYYNATNNLTTYIQTKTFALNGNPNGVQEAENGLQLANTGFFDENFNGGVNPYSLQSIDFTDHLGDSIEKWDYSNFCDFVAVINATGQVIGSSNYRIGLYYSPIDASIYQNKPLSLGNNLLLNAPDVTYQHSGVVDPTVQAGLSNDVGAQFDLSNLQFEIVGATVVVRGRITPNSNTVTYFDNIANGERKMMMFVQLGDFNLVNQFSNEVNLLIYNEDNFDAPTIGVQYPTVDSEALFDHANLDITDNTFPNTTTEDNILYKSSFLIDNDTELEGVRMRIFARNSLTGDEFTIEGEDVFVNFDNVPYINGIYEANVSVNRSFLLPPTTDKNVISLIRNPAIDTPTEYGIEINYGFLSRWQSWIEQVAVDNDFFDASLQNNGKNQNWQRFSTLGWDLYFGYYVRKDDVDDFQELLIKTRDYEDEPLVSIDRQLLVLSNGTTPNALVSNELMEITVTFLWNAPFSNEWAEFTMEDFEGNRVGFISSVLNHGGVIDNVLQPLTGETKLKITPSGNDLICVCLIDTSLINVNEVSTTYRAYSDPREPSGYLITTSREAEVAYSLRKLSNESVYNGACVKVRRSSDNATQDIQFLNGVINEDELASFVGAVASGYIHTWFDQSGNANNMVQTDNAKQYLLFQANTIILDPDNGKPASQADGTDDFYSFVSGIPTSQIFQQSWVFNRPNPSKINVSIASVLLNPYIAIWISSDTVICGVTSTLDKVIDGADVSVGSFLMTVLRDSNNDIKIWKNGVAGAGALNEPNVGGDLEQFGRRGVSGDYSSGFFQELIYWKDASQESNRLYIEANTNTFYSIF